MNVTKERPAGNGAPPTGKVAKANIARTADSAPWWHHVAWWTDPRLAYAKGLHDGAQLAEERADAELIEAMTVALGRSDLREGVAALIRFRDQVAARGGAPW